MHFLELLFLKLTIEIKRLKNKFVNVTCTLYFTFVLLIFLFQLSIKNGITNNLQIITCN